MQQFPVTIYENDVPIIFEDIESLNIFSKNYSVIHAAGGVVKNCKSEILMIYRLGKWDFPKGKVEASESVRAAALREVAEETGLHDIEILSELPNTYHTYILNGKKILKITHWFSMHCEDKSELKPQVEEDITRAVWLKHSEVGTKLETSYKSLKNFWNEVAECVE